MISSTFTDLKEHRLALIRAIKGQGLTDVSMENDSAKPDVDLIDSSLQMVRDSSAYIGIISRKYGQTPKCLERNPGDISITELEFNEAQRLNRPVLLFIMGDSHPIIEADVETNARKRKKLKAFRERAKKMRPDSEVHRVYATFEGIEEFKEKSIQAVANLRRYLDEHSPLVAQHPDESDKVEFHTVPVPPMFYAEPPYIGSHEFLGRSAELESLNYWASPADPHPIMLFDAIGGAGKSLLTWEWTTKHAINVREDWAGRFWYSFYEKGAIMADFCARALAYITRQPLKHFRKKKTPQLSEMLLGHLQARPWLLILDGLERVLVAYHRFDAAQVTDEEAGTSDQIAHRDPCASIRPEDDDLLRALAAAAPSKLVVTSRLVPRVLLNPAGQAIPGVLRVPLPGLRPPDAEALLRSCGVTGDSHDIHHYLKGHCDCHPLVIGVLAGLINDYLPDRGNFDAWAADPNYGGRLNLANLDLVQKRNHILYAALDALSEKNRQLLSTMALLSEAVDYQTLSAFNPHLPPEPEEVKEPPNPEDSFRWETLTDDEKEYERKDYEAAVQRRKEYEQTVLSRLQSREFLGAPHELAKTVRDLERRGLLQYDPQTKRHDLHPVVRGIAAGGLKPEEKEHYGQLVVDYFSRQAHNPYEQAETTEDLRNALHVVRTLLQMSRYKQAYDAYSGDLARALTSNLEANAEHLMLLRPFFPEGWSKMPHGLTGANASDLANMAASVLELMNESREAVELHGVSLHARLRRKSWSFVSQSLLNLSLSLRSLNRFAKQELCILRALEIATLIDNQEDIFMARYRRFSQLVNVGKWADAEVMWRLLDNMGRNWSRVSYVPGGAEASYVWFNFTKGTLTEEHLTRTEELAKSGRNRGVVRGLHRVRGQWYFEQGHYALAADSLREAIRMAREVGQSAPVSETWLALSNFHLGHLSNPNHEAEQLSAAKDINHYAVAELWMLVGDREGAKKHALKAYKEAWADGEPYVLRYELDKARFLLDRLGVEVPVLPPYDPAKDEELPWEVELEVAIEKHRVELAAKKAAQDS